MESTPSPFGRYVRAQRIKAGLSLRTVADAIKVSHVYLSEVERGVRGVLKRERWPDLVAAIPGVTLAALERHAETTRPIQIRIEDAPPQYQDLALALARRIRNRDLNATQLDEVLRLLNGNSEDL